MEEKDPKKEVLNLLNEPENSICADCHVNKSNWASCNLGIFICLECSGAHRSLGTHISFIRSCDLDSWNEGQIEKLKYIGNRLSNNYYEYNLPKGFVRPEPSDRSGTEKFIRDKYQYKLYADTRRKPPSELSPIELEHLRKKDGATNNGMEKINITEKNDDLDTFFDSDEDTKPQTQNDQSKQKNNLKNDELDAFFNDDGNDLLENHSKNNKSNLTQHDSVKSDELDAFFDSDGEAQLPKIRNQVLPPNIQSKDIQQPSHKDADYNVGNEKRSVKESFFGFINKIEDKIKSIKSDEQPSQQKEKFGMKLMSIFKKKETNEIDSNNNNQKQKAFVGDKTNSQICSNIEPQHNSTQEGIDGLSIDQKELDDFFKE